MSEIVCMVCGAPWVACAPGTASDAKSYAAEKVTDLRPAEEVPLQAWCEQHWNEKFKGVTVHGTHP